MLVGSWHGLKEVSTVLKTVGHSWQVAMLSAHYRILVASLMAYKNWISPLTLILQSGHSLLFDTYYSSRERLLLLDHAVYCLFTSFELINNHPFFKT